jgi:hypothetical protein
MVNIDGSDESDGLPCVAVIGGGNQMTFTARPMN